MNLDKVLHKEEKKNKKTMNKKSAKVEEDQYDQYGEKVHPDPYEIKIPKSDFEDIVMNQKKLAKNPMVVKQLMKVFQEHRQSLEKGAILRDEIILGDVEDNCLGYMQHNVKLFAFGKLFQGQRAFELPDDMNAEQDRQDAIIKGLGRKRRENLEKAGPQTTKNLVKVKVITKPLAIQFPQFTMPIVQVAAGQGQVLAITIDYEMYSWGEGGALGFGEETFIPRPRKLTIFDHKGGRYKIT